MPAPDAAPRIRWWPLVSGVALLATFGCMASLDGFGSQAGHGLNRVAEWEGFFWAAHAAVAVPGALLVGRGLQGVAVPRVRALAAAVAALSARDRVLAAVALGVVLFMLARLTRSLVLLDLPVTDDEYTVLFGARIMAAGRLSVPDLTPPGAFPVLYLHERGGMITAGDFPGGIVFGALSLVTGLGPGLYAAWAAVTGVAFAYTARCLAGDRAAWVGALLWAGSPMALWMSATSHPQMVSRGFVALALALYAHLLTDPGAPGSSGRWRAAAALGLTAGAAVACRPAEAGAILLPVAVHLVVRAAGARDARLVAAAALGAAVPLALCAAYNHAITGVWYLLPRLSPGALGYTPSHNSAWDRLATNVGFNLVMLGVFGLGPLGAPLVLLGATVRHPAVWVLLGGFALQVAVTMTHGNTGIHTVGPIHFSEVVVPLLLLATWGAMRAFDALAGLPRSPASPESPAALAAWLLIAYVAVGLVAFQVVHGRALREQAENQALALDVVRDAGLHHALVVAPQACAMWRENPRRARAGAWVFEFPPPDPFLRDDVLVASGRIDLAALRARFPERGFYAMSVVPSRSSAVIRPLAIHPPPGSATP